MGQPALAVISRNMDERSRLAYREMDFYSDRDRSAYRPWITIDRLKKANSFRYIGGVLVLRFSEANGLVRIECLDTRSDNRIEYQCRRLVLASGVLGTARIVLRSLEGEKQRLPLISNQYGLFPCVHWRMLGKEIEAKKSSFAQLSLFHDEGRSGENVGMALLYSYRALMMFRLVGPMRLNLVDSRIMLNYLMSGLVIMGIHHPEAASDSKNLHLEADADSVTGDKLLINYTSTVSELEARRSRERKYLKIMRSLGCHALGRFDAGPGSSFHYAGTLPFANSCEPFRLLENGQLSGTRKVFVADGSGFRFLPARGLTLSLMANAHLVAGGVAKLQ